MCTYGCETVGVLYKCISVSVCECVFGTVSIGVLHECVSVCVCTYGRETVGVLYELGVHLCVFI